MTQYIKRLPAVFQTVTEKKFFDATVDQLFSKKDSDLLSGYIGRRDPGNYNPITDFYLPEPSKNRTWWQLEATAFSRDADSTKTNIFFYDDLLERIEYYGGNTLNQDRLFESAYYSFGPPIDYDMFINYQNYYWVDQGLPSISISGVVAADIIGQPSYITPSTAVPANFAITSGMTISLTDDPVYSVSHVVENMGGSAGIALIPTSSDYTSGTLYEFLPWDGELELSTGRVIENIFWDGAPWEIQAQPGSADYITIERGAINRNAWSRTNKWFHIDTITSTIEQIGGNFPQNATRALRPIIQFIANLNLYKSGTQFRSEIKYGFRNNEIGNPILLSDLQNDLLSYINALLGISLADGDLVAFFNDTGIAVGNPWDTDPWYTDAWDSVIPQTINGYIYITNVQPDGSVIFTPHTSANTPVLEGDIVFATADAPYDGAQSGSTWYFSNGQWLQAFNDKVTINQPPLFQLYDHTGVMLDDTVKYPMSTFAGSKIFSYKVDSAPGATADPVLGFPIVYTSLGQASDIVFQNNLITNRYVYGDNRLPINGYYYYKESTSQIMYNNWNMYDTGTDVGDPWDADPWYTGAWDSVTPPVDYIKVSKQRVIDKYTVGYGTEYQFKLSVEPYGYPTAPDIIVSVNGTEVLNSTEQINGYTIYNINNKIYVDLTTYLSTLLTIKQSVAPVVEIQTYTHGLLDPAATGYSAIPQQLEANPTNLEIEEISASNLVEQFSSIISNQVGFEGSSFGGKNNYRDSRKNRSLGQYILQNVSPALKSMLVSSSTDLDFILGTRFSQDEYTKFKNKYISSALQLINQEFSPVAVFNNNVIISYWVDQIFKTLNVSKEFSNAFAYSYMVASGTPFSSESFTVPVGGLVTLTDYVDLRDPRNIIYAYDVTNPSVETLLVIGEDYEIVSDNLSIDVQFSTSLVGNSIYVALYKDPLPTYVPSTPSKVGTYSVYIPRIELDTTYVVPTNVIIGHDGSKTIAYNDYRDDLLLELEKRIYNFIQYKFRNEYSAPLVVESVKSGYFRQTRYSRDEYLNITESYLNKWSTKNRANYRNNDWAQQSPTAPLNELWKLYNYRAAVTPQGAATNLPGNWKGIFQYYYDTYYPDTRPWEMLGLSQKPSWWVTEYGSPVTNMAGQEVWTSVSSGLHNLWNDLELGIIRQGPSAIYDPVTLLPQPQTTWARPGLSLLIPVDASGELISVPVLFGLSMSGNPYAPFDGYDANWIYGDGGPVEQAWMSTSGYRYSIQEFMYLMRPGPYGEQMWDTLGTENSPGTLTVAGIVGPVKSSKNWQYVQNDTVTNSNPFFEWMRPKNEYQIVHAETVDNVVNVRFGYQCWISDRILFLNKNVGEVFGQKIRTLDVNLANKLAGFTNKDTTNTYIEAFSTASSSNSLIIPSTNFDVVLHKSPSVETYSYSGMIIRALADGKFAVYGYDVLNSEFIIQNRSSSKLIEVSVGGTPAEFSYFTPGATYNEGDIVRYNGVYFISKVTQTVQKFIESGWAKVAALPVTGGISVTYKPVSENTQTRLPYGSILDTPQDVFDAMIGWGAYLELQGWKFDEVSQDTNIINDWLTSAKQFLFWLNTNWAPDASIQLSPLANKATLVVGRGYPDDVESLSNGVYSILDKFGAAIPPNNTSTDREGRLISVEPNTLAAGGIYFLQINVSETEHVLIFDNTTSFNDIVYSPLLRARQQRLKFYGFRSNGWYGKMEAPGYLIIDNQMVPNFDTIVDSMRYFYDPDVTIDNPSLEDLGRHLIGYESKNYLDNLEVSNDVQYLFYQGAIRQKGTIQSFDKLFRSTKIQRDEVIQVFEEWALKVGDFGNTIEQVSTEFRLVPEQNTGEVIVARLNFVASEIGSVRQINILNAQNTYINVPSVNIALPDATPSVTWTVYDEYTSYTIGSVVRYNNAQGLPVYYTCKQATVPGPFNASYWTVLLETRIAKAYIVLDSEGYIARVGMIDGGYGYTTAPTISIDSGLESHSLDKLYSVWQGEIVKDATLDNIIDIDIDQSDVWLVRPTDPAIALVFPTTDIIDYPIPNAGYVNFNDVDHTSFDISSTALNWGTEGFNPAESDTLWIAKNFTEDWNVYKLDNLNPPSASANTWKILVNEAGNLLLCTNYSTTPELNVTIVPQLWNSLTGNRTDFGNMIVIQQTVGTVVLQDNNFTVGITPYITEDYNAPGIYVDPETLIEYNAYSLITLDGLGITPENIGGYSDINTVLLFKTMRWPTTPNVPVLPTYVRLNDYIWVDNLNGKWAVIKMQAEAGRWDIAPWDVQETGFWGEPYYSYGWDVTGPFYFAPYRIQAPLINTSFFENASAYDAGSKSELVQMPVYDPFKNILPALAKQNISYISYQDPARYNVTGEVRLYSDNILFGASQVGKLWWDTSYSRFVYYEQPIALDGSETELENLVYRRDRWAQLFPGSSVDIYEWVESSVPPSEYSGSGIPRDVTSYVVISTSNRFTSITETKYYFWVLNTTDKPNIINRTLTASEVSRLLQNPKSQGFVFFSPIQQTSTNNSYIFYNAQDILAYKGDNIQIDYRISAREDQEHTQWSFFREGDPSSLVTDQFWNKFVDSICGYTKVLPVSAEFTNGIVIANYLPWDIYGWDVAPWDNATVSSTPEYGLILPVPDPMLADGEKYGIEYRPRQSMFAKLSSARKILVQAANSLLQYIPVRDDTPGWNAGVSSDDYWTYVNWYKVGYENVVPTVVFSSLAMANSALLAGQLYIGQILQVTNGTPDGRYVLYAAVQLDPAVSTLSLEEVAIQDSAIRLLDTVYTSENKYGLSTELRQLLNSFRTEIMVDEYIVDQNELFFSMLNYVVSEQRNTDWLFKSSYIYVKENNIPLIQTSLYTPDQIDNVINYIIDAKPYHTQIRDYTSANTVSDIAAGTTIDSMRSSIVLQFGPDFAGQEYVIDTNNIDAVIGWDFFQGLNAAPWDTFEWDTTSMSLVNYGQYISRNRILPNAEPMPGNPWPDLLTVTLTFYDSSKVGYSDLFPYTFDFNGLNLDNPQTFITPTDVVSVRTSAGLLYYGIDYYVEYNTNGTYTIYFYNDPGVNPVAFVWIDGGELLTFRNYSHNAETADVVALDDMVVNVDTRLPVDISTGVPTPYVGFGGAWDNISGPIADILTDVGGSSAIPWDPLLDLEILPNTISFKENKPIVGNSKFYRNNELDSGTLVYNVLAPTENTYNIDVITVFVDPLTHPVTTDILPDPDQTPGVIWINGERIEYKDKRTAGPNTWELRLIRRGTGGTGPTEHLTMIPSLDNPLVLVNNPVWVEANNIMPPSSGDTVWNASNPTPDPTTIIAYGSELYDTLPWDTYVFTNVTSVPLGGLWYANSAEATFLINGQGVSIP